MTSEQLLLFLEELRTNRGQTIEEFYEAIGLSKSTINTWKRGAVPKSVELALNLIELLKTTDKF